MSQSDEPDTRPSRGARDYAVGYGKPPVHSRFKKGQSGNPRGRRAEPTSLAAILLDALRQKVVVATNGRRRRITKREAVIAQLVDKSAAADLRATKILLDMLADIERQAAARTPETPHPNPADLELLDALKARLRRLAEAHGQKGTEPERKLKGG
jgi:Family of unknown function (DUF5681)